MVIPRSVSDFFTREIRQSPCLVFSLGKAEANSRAQVEAMPVASHHDATRATPLVQLPPRLGDSGRHFECTSVSAIEIRVEAGARAEDTLNGIPLKQAVDFGLLPYRVSFHARSRPLESASSEQPTADMAAIFARLEQRGTMTTRVVDMGGRLPVDSEQAGDTGPTILADQTCDFNDGISPASCGYQLPIALKPGDRVVPTHNGGYTTASSANLNGYPLLSSLCI
jgi:diaminopimelate decarboxylase